MMAVDPRWLRRGSCEAGVSPWRVRRGGRGSPCEICSALFLRGDGAGFSSGSDGGVLQCCSTACLEEVRFLFPRGHWRSLVRLRLRRLLWLVGVVHGAPLLPRELSFPGRHLCRRLRTFFVPLCCCCWLLLRLPTSWPRGLWCGGRRWRRGQSRGADGWVLSSLIVFCFPMRGVRSLLWIGEEWWFGLQERCSLAGGGSAVPTMEEKEKQCVRGVSM